MTTVVCTRTEMASDSQLTGDYRASAKKIWKVNGGIVGIAGSYAACVQFVKWLQGKLEDLPEMDEVDAMVLTKEGKILHYNQSSEPFEIEDDYSAIGSGGAAAMAAMYMGADVERAIEVAILVDPGTGGKIQHHTIKRKT
jgi:ATP-dependent protease HslVU (ClpYQ) peptidase subunit